jgi:hypothetical protein
LAQALSYLSYKITCEKKWQAALADCMHQLHDIRGTGLEDYGFPHDWQMQFLWIRKT